nr:MAG TPA: hypothetical protein [Caudoviricetes sp.]
MKRNKKIERKGTVKRARMYFDELLYMDGQPVWVEGYAAHYGLVHIDEEMGPIYINHGLGCVEQIGNANIENLRKVSVEVDRTAELTLDDLAEMDKALVYVEDDNLGGRYALVDASPDAIDLYCADTPDDECCYSFCEDDGWARDDSIHIYACREVHHAD